MLVNGFTFSTIEIGRYSLFMITVAAAQNVIATVFGKYNDSIIGISSKFCSYVNRLLTDNHQSAASAGKNDKKDGKHSGKTSGAVAIIMQSPAKKIRSIILGENEKISAYFAYCGYLFGMYEPLKNSFVKAVFIWLAFMIFISAIRRRKIFDPAAAQHYIMNVWKTRISAHLEEGAEVFIFCTENIKSLKNKIERGTSCLG